MNKKENIIKIAADLFHKYSYQSVGLSMILKEANIPKGSFYHYFKNKDDLLIEVIHYFIDETISIFNNFSKSVDGLYGFFNAYFKRFEDIGFTRGCPIGNFALELSDVNEDARLCFKEWTTFLEKEIKMILLNENYESHEAKSLSSFMVSAFEGALLKAKIEKTKKPLNEFNYYIFGKILNYTEELIWQLEKK